MESVKEKMLAMQGDIIKKQQREINDLEASKRLLEAANQILAEALSRSLNANGGDRIFIPLTAIRADANLANAPFRVERTIDGDILLVMAQKNARAEKPDREGKT